jgi:uncharacterized membrane protein
MTISARPDATVFMDAVLTPNRSLSDGAFRIVVIATVAVSLLCGLYFLSSGAFPVLGFFGLDAALLIGALWLSRRDLRQETQIRVTRESVDLCHTDGRGGVRTASLPTAFARVELDRPVRPTSWLRLCLSDKTYVVGRFLTPEEREEFADALEGAIRRARSGVVA